eukprot:TRINITY_DN76617_c0_g1_i1.p1 TRINITY_DN76617_c0_g1~~TRINITY_DN76617_c0_g1_i1.p1  ORF type:complete len:397 (+),score=65.46 TRINITY_DN76617_c0_g1_i1:47-1237(+)
MAFKAPIMEAPTDIARCEEASLPTRTPTRTLELPAISNPRNTPRQEPAKPTSPLPDIHETAPSSSAAGAENDATKVVRRPRAGILRRQAVTLPAHPTTTPRQHDEGDVLQNAKASLGKASSVRPQSFLGPEDQRSQSKRRSSSKPSSSIEPAQDRTPRRRRTVGEPTAPPRGNFPSSFSAFREARRLQRASHSVSETTPVPTSSQQLDLANLAKRYGFAESDVRTRFEDFTKKDNDQDQALSVAEFEELIRLWCHLPANDMLPSHLTYSNLDPSFDGLVHFEETLAWLKEHQWTEEMLVPDPDERRFRHFCRDRGYPLADMDSIKEQFQKADRDRSGSIDIQEFGELISMMESSEVSDVKLRKLFYEIDLDGSGFIDFYEFAVWFVQLGVKPKISR